ncbi:hypothetical protein SESBI_47355 [Sesbania bispinosa]|nr:hypothetical protein SESBI_47355 [Sesbania bispinosa]
MSSNDLNSQTDPNESNSSSSFSTLLGDNPLQTETLVPVINVEDSKETESDLDSQFRENRNTPVYQTFLTELPTGGEVGWVSLNSIHTKGVLSAYTSSYKKWKQKFFRVRGVGAMSTLLVSEDGSPHFPLFWSLEPRRVPGFDYNDLSFDEKIDVAFLRNSAPLDCGFLLENEDLPDRLRQILDKMPPKADVPRTLVNEKAMRRWLKKAGGEPDGRATGGNVNQPTISTIERRKKPRLDDPGETQSKVKTTQESPAKTIIQNIPPQQPASKSNPIPTQTGIHASSGTQGQGASSSLPPLGDKWWTLFNNFEGAEGSKVNSIFDHRFNVERVVSREFNKKEDRTRVNKVGMRNVGKHLMTMGMQTAFFGYCFDSGMNSADKEL